MVTQVMGQFNRGLDALIDIVISFTDYFIVEQHVTLSEASLFAIAVTRTIWIIVFGVNSENYEMLWGYETWFFIYLALTLAHVAAFFTRRVFLRFLVCCGHALIWSFLSITMLMTGSRSISIPMLAVLMGLSVFIAVRLYRDKRLSLKYDPGD
jgi:hypothetical protein